MPKLVKMVIDGFGWAVSLAVDLSQANMLGPQSLARPYVPEVMAGTTCRCRRVDVKFQVQVAGLHSSAQPRLE